MRFSVLAALVALAIPVAGAQAGGGLLGGLHGAVAGGNCGSSSPVFSSWGDRADYYFAPNGGFESGASGWTLSGGATVVPGSETYAVHSSGDASSLAIPAGGSASTTVCYGLTYPGARFFAESTGDGPATIHVRVVTRGLLGGLSTLDGGTFQVDGSWQPSPRLSTLFSALAAPLGAKSMTLEISVESGSADIDDLYVDPFLRIA
jgi:hypothetical protein